MNPEPLKNKMYPHNGIGVAKYKDIKSAVEGLIKFHDDRIESMKKYIQSIKGIKDRGFVDLRDLTIEFTKEKIKQEYESIKAIEHWLEDVI